MSESPAHQRKCILVLGMHRSGTSAMTRTINAMGAALPSNLIPPLEDNAEGFWESEDMVHIHNRFMVAVDHGWNDPRPLPREAYDTPAGLVCQAELMALLRRDFTDQSLFVIKDPRISIEPLLTEPLLLVVGQNHPFSSRKEIDVADLAEETFVTMGDSSTLAIQIQGFFGDHNFVPKVGYRCAQVATLKLFVSMGLGISILPQVAHTHDDEGNLIYLHLSGTAPTRQIAVIRHLQRYQSRGAEQFLGLLRDYARTGGFSAPPFVAPPKAETPAKGGTAT